MNFSVSLRDRSIDCINLSKRFCKPLLQIPLPSTSTCIRFFLLLFGAIVGALWTFSVVVIDSEAYFPNEPTKPLPDCSLVPKRRSDTSKNITIVLVFEGDSPLDLYSIGMNSMECYARTHGYNFVMAIDSDHSVACKHKDPMFRRHCVVAELLSNAEYNSWFLFLDADVLVINPNRLIEEYIDERFDITLYDRFYNWEVAAGSYLLRTCNLSIAFLRGFADYEKKLHEDSFSGTDNGALHMYLLEFLKLDGSSIVKAKGWVRDIWITGSGWSDPEDFMLHSVKATYEIELPEGILARKWRAYQQWKGVISKYMFINPLTKRLNSSKCATATEKWERDPRTLISSRKKAERLDEFAKEIDARRWKTYAEFPKYF